MIARFGFFSVLVKSDSFLEKPVFQPRPTDLSSGITWFSRQRTRALDGVNCFGVRIADRGG